MTDVYRPGIKRSWFNLAYTEETKTADIYLYNDIGFFGITAQDFKEQLLSINATDLNIYINSLGGEVGDGLAIYNLLKRHEGKKTVHIDGMAASIASVIAMAGDEIIMPETALMFLHQPWTMTAGNADDLQRTAEHLQKTEAAIIAAYANKTGLDAAFISNLLRDETTLSASEAITLKFADKLTKDEPVTEFAFAGAMMNRVLCKMAKKMTKEKNEMETPEPVVTDIAPVDEPDSVVEPIVEVVADEPDSVVEPIVEPQPDPVVDNRAEFKSFVARFGAVRASAYFAAGMSFTDSEQAYLSELEAENAELKARASQSGVKPVAVKPTTDTAPMTYEQAQAEYANITDPKAKADFREKHAVELRLKK